MKVLILTTGKTGSTALAYSIQKKLHDCEIVFEPPSLDFSSDLSENTVVKFLKINQWKKNSANFQLFDVSLLLVRHPFDQLLSLLLYAPYDGHGFSNDSLSVDYFNLLMSKSKDSSSCSVLDIVNLFCKITEREVEPFLNFASSIYRSYIDCYNAHKEIFDIVKYEDFVDNKLAGIEDKIGVKISSDVEVDPQFSRVKRSARYGDWMKWFSDSDIESLKTNYSEAMQLFGYSTDRSSVDSDEISYDQSAGYFVKIVNQYRKMYKLPAFDPSEVVISEDGYFFDKAVTAMREGNNLEALNFLEKCNSLDASNQLKSKLKELTNH